MNKYTWGLDKEKDAPEHPFYESKNILCLGDRAIGHIKKQEQKWVFVFDSQEFVLDSENKPIGWIYQQCEQIVSERI